MIREPTEFIFNGKRYCYFDHRSNQTHKNERRVELPICFDYADNYSPIIEIGNVLQHYRRGYSHDVLDLHEQANWPVIHEDVLTWKPEREYECAISISTVEHTADPPKAVERILSFAPRVIITWALGYFPLPVFPNMFFMKRYHKNNWWVQANREEVEDYSYDKPFPYGNAIAIVMK